MSDKRYYSKGLQIWKAPIREKVDNGTRVTLGFHACTATDVIGEEGAAAIAELLHMAEQFQAAATDAATPSPSQHTNGVTYDRIERLMHAVEGECDGLAIDAGQAMAILAHVMSDEAPPENHVDARIPDLEKEIKDLKHDLASAEGRAKNATSNCDYWRGQYEALASTSCQSSIDNSTDAPPQTNTTGVIAAFEAAYPDHYWHIAKGKITAGEPLYGAIITDVFGNEIGDGESDVSADEALRIAIEDAGLEMPALQTNAEDVDRCPICAEPFKPDDICATDIELLTVHAECLEGCEIVDLETGEPTDKPLSTYRYSEVMEPASPQTNAKVSPLEWRTLDNGTAWSRLTLVGLSYHATSAGWMHRNGELHPTDGIEEAKAAAQADYEVRILSCLATPEGQP